MLHRAITLIVKTVISGFSQRQTASDFSVVTGVDKCTQQEVQLEPNSCTEFVVDKFIQIRSSDVVEMKIDSTTLNTKYFASIFNEAHTITLHNTNESAVILDIVRG